MNHDAIRKVYPNAVSIDDKFGVFDSSGNKIDINQELVNSALVIVEIENAQREASEKRRMAYILESDPLFFKARRGEVNDSEWISKIEEIRQRFPYVS